MSAAGKQSNAGNTMRDQLTDALGLKDEDFPDPDETTKRRRKKDGKSSRKGRKEQSVVEDVEIFNIDTGWSEEALKEEGLLIDTEKLAGIDMKDVDLSDFNLDDLDLDNLSDDDSDEDFDDDGQTEWTTENYDSSVFGEVNTSCKDGSSASQAKSEAGGKQLRNQLRPQTDTLRVQGSDDDDLAGWTVSSVPDGYQVEKPSQASASIQKADKSEMGSVVRNLLDSMPSEMSKRLRRAEAEGELEDSATNPRALAKAAARRKTHRRLRIISGTFGGKRLLSPQGDVVRPMMEMVKAAVFSMIQSRLGGSPTLPENSRWLDLFAGTGSIGLEALSRGCTSAAFIELDPWVTKACLKPNIATCQMESTANVFTTKAESFMARAAKTPGFAGGPFDFISVCPPYLLVSYPELFELLESSSLSKPSSIILVEYPKRLAHEIPETLCGLEKVRDRKYGRTFLALYAPPEEGENDDADGTWQKYS